jgi:hypothetical protein
MALPMRDSNLMSEEPPPSYIIIIIVYQCHASLGVNGSHIIKTILVVYAECGGLDFWSNLHACCPLFPRAYCPFLMDEVVKVRSIKMRAEDQSWKNTEAGQQNTPTPFKQGPACHKLADELSALPKLIRPILHYDAKSLNQSLFIRIFNVK